MATTTYQPANKPENLQGDHGSFNVSMKQLLEAGVHFGHQSRRWNPKMDKYVYTERNGIYIIDLKKTIKLLRDAYNYVKDRAAEGKTFMFIGTKKQAKESIYTAATACNMHYVNNRWLGGMLTNFRTVQNSIKRLIEIDKMIEDGSIEQFKKKEQSMLIRERNALDKNLAGMKTMKKMPDVVIIIDPHKEHIAVHECQRLGIPIVAVVDTNCDPDPIDVVIPGNDDAIRAIKLIADVMSNAVNEGRLIASEMGNATEEPVADEPHIFSAAEIDAKNQALEQNAAPESAPAATETETTTPE